MSIIPAWASDLFANVMCMKNIQQKLSYAESYRLWSFYIHFHFNLFFLLCSFLYKTFSDSSANGGIQGKFRSFIDPGTFLYSTISHTSTEGFEICMSGIVFNRDNYSQFLGWRKLSLCQLFLFGLISSSLELWSWRFGPFPHPAFFRYPPIRITFREFIFNPISIYFWGINEYIYGGVILKIYRSVQK